MAVEQESGTPRHQRADAARNRTRLLAIADELFQERGLEVSVGEIAERAGVGRATLFRNFPTKQDLIIAVVLERIEAALAEGRAQLEAAPDDELLFPFMKELIGRQRVDRGLFEAVGEDAFLTDERMLRAHAAIVELIDGFIAHDEGLGYVRPGLGGIDMLMLVKGACAVATSIGELWPEALERYLSVIRGAITAPGRPCPLEGSAPTFEDLHGRRTPAGS